MIRSTIAIFAVVCAGAVFSAAQETGDPPSKPEKPSDKKSDHNHDDATAHRLKYFDDIEVTSRGDNLLGIAGSANEGTTSREDLERRPKLRSGELVETVPGAIATQHSGGGKANQYFLRGFNLDHGTMTAFWLELDSELLFVGDGGTTEASRLKGSTMFTFIGWRNRPRG